VARTILAAAAALAVASVPGAAAPATAATAEPPGLFVLPVRTDRWGGSVLGPGEPRLLEARITTALARGRRVRAVSARDVPPEARAELPRDLAACITPACLALLAKATGAERVLAVELLDEDAGPVLFATLYDAATGVVVDRRELPDPITAPATRAWAVELARWASGAPPPPPPPSLVVDVGPAQAGRPEARALRGQLIALLQARPWPYLAAPWGAEAQARPTHRVLVTIENVAVSDRVHHIHRYRHGVLVARLDVVDARGGPALWSRREAAELTARSDEAGNQQIVDALVADLASRFDVALTDPVLERLINRRGNP
jgi:hypothetical protein